MFELLIVFNTSPRFPKPVFAFNTTFLITIAEIGFVDVM